MKRTTAQVLAAFSVILPVSYAFQDDAPEPFRDYCNPTAHYRHKIGRISHGFSPSSETADYDARTQASYYLDKPEFLEADGRLGTKVYQEIERVGREYLARFNDLTQIDDEKSGWGAKYSEENAYGETERFPRQTVSFNFPRKSTHQSITVANSGVLESDPERSTFFDQHIFLFPRVQQPSFNVIRCAGIPASAARRLGEFLLPMDEALTEKYCADPVIASLYGDRYLTVITLSTGEEAVVDAHTSLDPTTPFETPEFQVVAGALTQIPRQQLYLRRAHQARVYLYPKFLLDYRGAGMQIEFAESDFYTGLKGINAVGNPSAPVRVTCGESCVCTKPAGCKLDAVSRFSCKLPFSRMFDRFSAQDPNSRSECVKLTAGAPTTDAETYRPADDEAVQAAVEKACGFRLKPVLAE